MGKYKETPWEARNHPLFEYSERPGDNTVRFKFQTRSIRGFAALEKYIRESESQTFRIMKDKYYTLECVPANEVKPGDTLYFNISGQFLYVWEIGRQSWGGIPNITFADTDRITHPVQANRKVWRVIATTSRA